MTNEEAVKMLTACKELAERVTAAFPGGIPLNYPLNEQDLQVLRGFDMVQADPVVAGPGLLNRMFNQIGLTQVEVYKLGQLRRLVIKRRYAGRSVSDRYKSGSGS